MKQSLIGIRWKLLFLILLLLAAGVLWMLLRGSAPAKPGIFCWDKELLEQPSSGEALQWIQQAGFGEVYQYIPKDADVAAVRSFARDAAEESLDLYLLAGDPSWALAEKADRISQTVLRAALYNQELEDEARLNGVVIDVEPYLLDEWDQEEVREEIWNTFLDTMESGCRTALDQGLDFIVCIPYYYDNWGYEDQLLELITRACTGIAIMNYNKSDELEQIRTECTMAEEQGKEVIVIYELQEEGSHGLTFKNTYHSDGIPALLESWQSLAGHLSAPRLRYAVHEFNAAKEVFGDE